MELKTRFLAALVIILFIVCVMQYCSGRSASEKVAESAKTIQCVQECIKTSK